MTNSSSCFLCGVGFGIVAGLIFAPKSGDKMREELRRKAKDTSGYLRKQTADASSQINDTFDRATRAVNETAAGIGKAFATGKQTLMS